MSISPELDVLGDIRRTLIMRMAAAESEWDHGMLTDEGYRARKDAIVTEVAGLFRDTLRRTMGLEAGKDA